MRVMPWKCCSRAAGCGKTTWAVQHARAHPDRRYVILGASFVLEQMRVGPLAYPALPYPEELTALIHVGSWAPALAWSRCGYGP